MALVAPVNLPYNIKTLWFDPDGLELHADDSVVVQTARGLELGVLASEPFEVPYEDIKKLKSPLKPVKRVATEEDLQRADEMEQKAREAMPVFKRMAREYNEDMHPVSVEYMLDGDKAVFYFESEERIDFRELVRKLASEFHVRIDMRQIGVRDEARIVGGIAHCGQLVCCKRLGGEFKPVSIRMAKDQDLSLNPQKISGLCGRLMCCLRYEDEVYKEFKKAAPKIGAVVSTPAGEGKVVEYDVPRDTVAIRVEDEKPVKVPASAIDDLSDDRKRATVSDEAWEEAVEDAKVSIFGGTDLFSIPASPARTSWEARRPCTTSSRRRTSPPARRRGAARAVRAQAAAPRAERAASSRRSGSRAGGPPPSRPRTGRRRPSTARARTSRAARGKAPRRSRAARAVLARVQGSRARRPRRVPARSRRRVCAQGRSRRGLHTTRARRRAPSRATASRGRTATAGAVGAGLPARAALRTVRRRASRASRATASRWQAGQGRLRRPFRRKRRFRPEGGIGDARDWALFTDLYQLTMAQGYWLSGKEGEQATFTMHFRNYPFEGGYAVACGMAQLARWSTSTISTRATSSTCAPSRRRRAAPCSTRGSSTTLRT